MKKEWNLPLCLAFVHYEKAFDSIETWAVLESLQRCQIDYRYIEELEVFVRKRCVGASAGSVVEAYTTIQQQRKVRHGDIISPKLFTASLEYVFRLLDWKGLDINIKG